MMSVTSKVKGDEIHVLIIMQRYLVTHFIYIKKLNLNSTF